MFFLKLIWFIFNNSLFFKLDVGWQLCCRRKTISSSNGWTFWCVWDDIPREQGELHTLPLGGNLLWSIIWEQCLQNLCCKLIPIPPQLKIWFFAWWNSSPTSNALLYKDYNIIYIYIYIVSLYKPLRVLVHKIDLFIPFQVIFFGPIVQFYYFSARWLYLPQFWHQWHIWAFTRCLMV